MPAKATLMPYRAPLDEIKFVLGMLGADRLAQSDLFAEAGPETIDAILAEAAKLAENVMEPVQRSGDLHPARLENGVVRTSLGFAEAFKAIAAGGWIGISADPEYGGMGLPLTLATCVNEMQSSACLSLQLAPLMAQGQIEALEHHASGALKALYLPKLISGEWSATMNLTEAQAGSDVGALRSKAEPKGDGTFAISGQKIFITWGDHDVAENIVHLVLARLPNAPQGTKGISLFLVPKFLPDAKANTLRAISLEHKLGLHGSPTAVMQYDGATGWLVGAEGGGMAAMFTMMNNARLGVGVQGLGVAEAAYQKALAYAQGRVQGKPLAGGDTIIGHADVRRMLLKMQAMTAVSRAICLDCALSLDMSKATGEKAWAARAAFLTPMAKAFGTDTGCQVADLGIQVHGGMGFIEETGAAQLWRDVRVTAIYEGTNGIQAMDLVGRKLMDGGKAGLALLDEAATTAPEAAATLPDLAEVLQKAVGDTGSALQWLVGQTDMNARFAGAANFLRAFALTLGGHYLLKAALIDPEHRTALARFHAFHLMPEIGGLLASVKRGDSDLGE